MQKRHQDALPQRLEVLAFKGFAFIEFWELRLWYEAERITKTVWQDVKARFDDVSNDESELSKYVAQSGILLIRADKIEDVLG